MKNRRVNSAIVLITIAVAFVGVRSQTINLQLQNTYTLGAGALTPRFAVGDLNNDGRPDVVTAGGLVGQAFNVQLNNGSGGLGTANPIGASLNATAVAIGDFNNDGNADLAVGSISNVGINIRLGDGSGNFPNGTNTTFVDAVTDIVTADFNGDGNLDLATVNRNGTSFVKVLLGDGHGAFSGPTTFAVGSSPLDIEVADFNADGRPDMAIVAFATTNTVTVLLNNGSGGFTAAPSVSWANATANGHLVAADFNRDCRTDLAVVRTDSIAILLGDNTGSFALSSIAATTPTSVVAGDFNLDRIPDIAIGHLTAPNFTALPGDGAGGFGTPFPITLTQSIDNVGLLDVNLDGRMDVLLSQRSNSFSLYNDASNYFRRTDNDYDNDGRADLGVFRPSDGNWYLQRSTLGITGSHWGISTDKPVPADYDADLKTDLAVWRENGLGDPNRSYFFILRSSDSTVRVEQFGRIGDFPVVGDWDGDGKADVAVYRNGDSAGAQSYFFYRPSSVPGSDFNAILWGTNGDEAVRGDFDGDGHLDAAVFRPSNGIWYILQSSNGQALYQSWGLASDRRVPADYDGDGHTDLAVFRPSSGVWYIRNSSNGTLTSRPWGTAGDSLTPGDYNGDGKSDVAVYRPSDQRWHIPPCATYAGLDEKFGTANDVPVQAVP